MIEEFKTFIAVVDFKNFTKAAEYLNLSQPSVSTHIKNLEIIFGVTLINRSVRQKTISITESGFDYNAIMTHSNCNYDLSIVSLTIQYTKNNT